MQERDRAYRRWQFDKKKKKVSRYWNNWWYVNVDDENESPKTISYGDRFLHKNGFTKDLKRIGKIARTPDPCGRYCMCSRSRVVMGPSLQELRQRGPDEPPIRKARQRFRLISEEIDSWK